MIEIKIVNDNSKQVAKAIDEALKKAARIIGGTMEGYAKDLSPVDTGLLRNSITFAIGGQLPNKTEYQSNEKDKNGNRIEVKEGRYEAAAPQDKKNEVTLYVGTNVQYAPYQELGAPNINLPAAPFLRPAFENHREEIEEILRRELAKI